MKKILLIVVPIVLFACQKELSIEGLGTSNKSPIANAGINQFITLPVDSVLLDGTSSTDPDGFIAECRWTKISGPSFYNIIHPIAMKTMLNNLTAGVYKFELKVTDNRGAFTKDTMQVVVYNPGQSNRPPIANAGTDLSITLPLNAVTANGAASSDPDGNINQWRWTKISGPSSFQIANPDVMQTTITDLVEGLYEFELKVTDSYGLSDKDTMFVLVNPRLNWGNVNFYFPDPTGSIPYTYVIFTNPSPPLITVTINNLSNTLSGIWCPSCSPTCPMSSDYNVEFGNYVDFNLPPGIYNWTAVSSIINLSYPSTSPALRQFFSTSHSTGGTLTVSPGDSCILVKIVF